MITALLKRIEEIYTAAEELITGGGYSRLLSNWVTVVIIVCIAAFVIDQTIWILAYKPYKRWLKTVRGFNRVADRLMDAVLELAGRAGGRAGGAQTDDDADGVRALPKPRKAVSARAEGADNPLTRAEKSADDIVTARSIPKPHEAKTPDAQRPAPIPGDWTSIPASYEGVRWWEPADKEQI